MTWQTKAMYVFQSTIIICGTIAGIMAVGLDNLALKKLLAGVDISLVVIDVIGLVIYARYVRATN